MAVKIREAIVGLEDELAAVGTTARAAGEKRYLKSELEFLGATVPATRKIAGRWLREHPALGHRDLVRLVAALWRRRVHELRMVGIELLKSRSDLLGPGDLALLESMLRRSKTWAYVDTLAIHLVGDLVRRHPELSATLDLWSRDDDFWIRRSALLALLPALLGGDPVWERWSGYADGMLSESEFFVRKAIGWVLREVGKRDPERVSTWVAARTARISGVSLREAVRHLPEDDRRRLLDAYRKR